MPLCHAELVSSSGKIRAAAEGSLIYFLSEIVWIQMNEKAMEILTARDKARAIKSNLVFYSEEGNKIDPDNLYSRCSQKVIFKLIDS